MENKYDENRPHKAIRFDYLVKRTDLAITEEFYLEASWICYAIIEDRMRSIIVKLNGSVKNRWKIYDCTTEIYKLKESDETIKKYFSDELLFKINDWREKRNNLMHELVEGTSQDIEFKDIAVEGRNILRELKDKVRKFKKALIKENRLKKLED